MNTPFQNHSGFTLVELLVLIAVIMILSILVYPGGAASKRKAMRINCVNNLKQVGFAFRTYAGDITGNSAAPSANEKSLGNEITLVYQYFKLATNELGTPKVLHCPADEGRLVATNFTSFNSTNISYFIGLDRKTNYANAIFSGDRNITNGFAPTNGILELTPKHVVGWTKEIHKFEGNIALGDGSVQQVSSARLRSEIIAKSDLTTNRIQLP